MTIDVIWRLTGLTGSRIAPVLARLDAIPGLQKAQVDHRGELLHLVVAEEDVLATVGRETVQPRLPGRAAERG